MHSQSMAKPKDTSPSCELSSRVLRGSLAAPFINTLTTRRVPQWLRRSDRETVLSVDDQPYTLWDDGGRTLSIEAGIPCSTA